MGFNFCGCVLRLQKYRKSGEPINLGGGDQFAETKIPIRESTQAPDG